MIRAITVLLLLLSAGRTFATTPTLTHAGIGPIRFGMKIAEVEARLHEQVPPAANSDEEVCRWVRFKQLPGAGFMVEKGVFTRADVDSTVGNSLGISVGQAIKDVTNKYPKAKVSPNFYDSSAHDILLTSKNKQTAFVLQEREGKIAEIRAGLVNPVQYVEGCQ